MLTLREVRKKYLDFFEKNGHTIVKSSATIPDNDPTLMFTNSGMVQFKDALLGNEKRDYTRCASAQKCVRAGGKHNDLDNVGYTARHHTFFEMMGNWSFNDYFKREAITLAYKFLTEELGLPADKLLATVYHTDEEAYSIWKEITGWGDDKIIRISTKDNFWEMGDTGPCGPCSEIFYDNGPEIWGGKPGTPEEDGDRYIEIWNLVFMQNQRIEDGSLKDLGLKNIDTGMGLERMTAILQGTHNNFEIDLFQNIIRDIEKLTGVKAEGDDLFSFRIIADHLRCSSFLIADGLLPSNEGRGYVLRRIMRRAMRHAHILGCKEPLMYKLVPSLLREMGEDYPELERAKSLIEQTLEIEEKNFKKTLDNGLKMLAEESSKLGESGVLSGEVAFKLYDTYGFPMDLTQDILKSEGKTVDTDGFEKAMEEQKEKARSSWKGSGDSGTNKVWYEIKEKCGATDFLGYKTLHAEANVLALVQDGKEIDSISSGEAFIITNQTPFYGESGGQVGDIGSIENNNFKAEILDTKKEFGDLFIHHIKMLSGDIKVKDEVSMTVDKAHRNAVRANHSATHLLQKALREVLGGTVAQKGSSVNPNRLRFDFSYPTALTKEEILEVERKVNEKICENGKIVTELMPADQAFETGAMALFGEKYGDEVRVVSMVESENGFYSIELCGGTHADRTGDIGSIKILSDISVSAGVRRIEAITGQAVINYLNSKLDIISECCAEVKSSEDELVNKISKLQKEKKDLSNEVSSLKQKVALGGSTSGSDDITDINGIKVNFKKLAGVPAKDLKPMAEKLRGEGVAILISEDEGKVSVVVAVNQDITDKANAVDIVRKASEILGGKGGGGRPDMAQAGGNDFSKADEVLTAVKEILK